MNVKRYFAVTIIGTLFMAREGDLKSSRLLDSSSP